MTKKKSTFDAWLRSKGLTPQDVANKAGLSYHTIVKWRHNPDRNPRDAQAEKLGRAFPDCPLAA